MVSIQALLRMKTPSPTFGAELVAKSHRDEFWWTDAGLGCYKNSVNKASLLIISFHKKESPLASRPER
jgi:hypothetical protein